MYCLAQLGGTVNISQANIYVYVRINKEKYIDARMYTYILTQKTPTCQLYLLFMVADEIFNWVNGRINISANKFCKAIVGMVFYYWCRSFPLVASNVTKTSTIFMSLWCVKLNKNGLTWICCNELSEDLFLFLFISRCLIRGIILI